MKTPFLFFSLFLVLGFSSPSTAQSQKPTFIPTETPAPFQTLDAETQFKTPLGGDFKVPKGWEVSSENGVFIFHDPDNQLVAALLENQKSAGEGAIESAWKTVMPQNYKVVTDTLYRPEPAKYHGQWDEIIHLTYHLTPEASKVFWADARKKGHACYIFLVYGDRAAVDRRTAQLSLIHESLNLPGFAGEVFRGMTAYPLDSNRAKNLDDFIKHALDKCKIPGAAVAVVQNGQVVYEKGFGVREKDKKEPVTPQTLFMIGSTTKPLTSLMLARLVDAGLFTWDTPVVKIMPGFRLVDPQITREVTVKDTLCACVGLPREDMELAFDTAKGTPEGLMDQIGTLQPTTGFGETFQYSNQMAAAGGYIAAHALYRKKTLGEAYDEAMQSQVFDPLGMKDTTLDVKAAVQKDYASPHGYKLNGDCILLPLTVEEMTAPVRSAMGVWSNVDDMTKYLLMELSEGKGPDGSEFVSKPNLMKRREAQVEISDKSSYGVGLMMSRSHGLDYFGHDGTVAGFTSSMAFYPDQGFGVITLANADKSEIFTAAVQKRLFELLFDHKPEVQDDLDEACDKKQTLAWGMAFHSNFGDSDLFHKLEGRYGNETLGSLSILLEEGKAYLVTDEWSAPIAAFYSNDTGQRIIVGGSPMLGTLLKVGDRAGQMTLTFETPQKEYVFKQVVPEKAP